MTRYCELMRPKANVDQAQDPTGFVRKHKSELVCLVVRAIYGLRSNEGDGEGEIKLRKRKLSEGGCVKP